MPPPLAGKPPFATDQPDTYYADHPASQRRPRKRSLVDHTAPGGARESAYTAFDSYYASANDPAADIGRGLINGGDDDDDDDDPSGHSHPDNHQSRPQDKHQALFEAAVGRTPSSSRRAQPQEVGRTPSSSHRAQPPTVGRTPSSSSRRAHPPDVARAPSLSNRAHPPDVARTPSASHRAHAPAVNRTLSSSSRAHPNDHEGQVPRPRNERARPPPLQQPPVAMSAVRTVRQPQPPILRQNTTHVSQHIEPGSPPGARPLTQQQHHPVLAPPPALQAGLRAPAPRHPPGVLTISPPQSPLTQSPTSPLTPQTPALLPPPQTPIHPVFALPASRVSFSEKAMPRTRHDILRGNSEETLLARGTGGKGDDFWRRFSMVAHNDALTGSKKSAWLNKTEHGTTRLQTWVWIVGIILLLLIGGGIGLAYFFTHNRPASGPVAIGGSAGERGYNTTSVSSTSTQSVTPTKVTAAPVPKNTAGSGGTFGRRAVEVALEAAVPTSAVHQRARRHTVKP